MDCKIYLLTDKLDNKVYVGQTWLEFDDRMKRNGSGYANSPRLFAAIQKNGAENFEYSTLDTAKTDIQADILEDFYMDKYNSKDPQFGYNIKSAGSHGRHSEETKAKIAESLKGREKSEETRRRLSEALAGGTKPPLTEERKTAISEHMIEFHAHNLHPMQERHHTTEAKAAMSEKLSGKTFSPEVIEKRRKSRMEEQWVQDLVIDAYLGGKTIKEIRDIFHFGGNGKVYRILKANGVTLLNNFSKWEGKKHSEETKEKMSFARKEYWNFGIHLK